MVGQSCVVRYTVPFAGLAAVLPQLEPPRAPGSDRLSYKPGGVNRPSLRMLAIRSFHEACSAGVRMYGFTSAAVIFWRAKGGGMVGIGWVGQACSPGISLFGTGRSSIGQRGLPVTRSNTYKKPCFVACGTASIGLPL